jgi:hypothetical protein
VLRQWQVFSLERTFHTSTHGSPVRREFASVEETGEFIADPHLTCTPKAALPRSASLSRRVSVKVTREMKCKELVDSTQAYVASLKILDGYYTELKITLTPEEHREVFANFSEVLRSSVEWLQLLILWHNRDPEWTEPIGELLLQGATIIGEPVIHFCKETQFDAELIANMSALSPAVADDLSEVQELMKTNLTLPTALMIPGNQAVANQQFIAFIANATPIFHADREVVLQARNAFDAIAVQVNAVRPRATRPIARRRSSRMTSLREGVRNSVIFDSIPSLDGVNAPEPNRRPSAIIEDDLGLFTLIFMRELTRCRRRMTFSTLRSILYLFFSFSPGFIFYPLCQ